MTLHMLIFGIGLAAFAGLVLTLLVHADRLRRKHRARLSRARPNAPQLAVITRRKITDTQGQHGLAAQIERHLSQTNLRTSVTELLVQCALAALGIYAVSVLVLGLHPLFALGGAIAVPFGIATLVLRIAKTRYRTDFTTALPEALDVFARGLRAGRPVADSISTVVETSKGPIHREFLRCRDEIRMGATLPDSLGRLEARMPTPEVSFFAVATSLQAETGGNLIETMEGLADQLRQRRQLRRKARALSSEARASAFILAALPFAVTFAIGLLNAGYLEPLYADPRGRIMSLIALTSIALGIFVMAQMGKLDV